MDHVVKKKWFSVSGGRTGHSSKGFNQKYSDLICTITVIQINFVYIKHSTHNAVDPKCFTALTQENKHNGREEKSE